MATEIQLKEIAENYKTIQKKYFYKFCENTGRVKIVETRRNCNCSIQKNKESFNKR